MGGGGNVSLKGGTRGVRGEGAREGGIRSRGP